MILTDSETRFQYLNVAASEAIIASRSGILVLENNLNVGYYNSSAKISMPTAIRDNSTVTGP